jgi:hypothetical protein
MDTIPTTNNTIAVPPLDMLKYQLIEQHSNTLWHLRNYLRKEHRTREQPSNHEFHTSVEILYYMLEPTLFRWLPLKEFKILESRVQSIHYAENLKAFRCISSWLDRKRVTRIDLESEYDSSSFETENKAKGV